MTRGVRITRAAAVTGWVILLIVSVFMGAWGLLNGVLDLDESETQLTYLLLGGAAVAVLGILVSGVLLLVGLATPQRSRHWVRIVALIVIVLALLGGPVRVGVQYARLASAESAEYVTFSSG